LTILARGSYRFGEGGEAAHKPPNPCGSANVIYEINLIYEIRVYEAAEGRAAAMRRRFVDEVAAKFFPRHGIELIGVFTAPVEDGRLTYLTRFADEDARQKAWASFGADPEWAAVKAASETNGPLLKSQQVSVLSPALAGLLLG
jgi:hypothetical protein